MMEWLKQREPREQIVLALGALLVVVFIGWKFLWIPLQNRSQDLADSVAHKSDLIVDLRRAANLSAAAAGPGTTGVGTSLTVVINLTAEPLGLDSAIERSTPVGGGDAIRVTLIAAPFDTLVSWLDTLERQYGVGVATADITRADQTGLINGRIVLDRS